MEQDLQKQQAPFTHGAIVRPFVPFMLPIMLAQFLQVLYGAVDLIVIGHFVPSDEVQAAAAAVGTGSMIMTLLNMVISGLTMGTIVTLGQCIGAMDREGASKVVGSTFCIFIIFSVLVTAVMEIFATQFSVLLNALSVEMTVQYIRICSAGIIFITFYNVIGAIFRATGDSRNPLIFVLIACIVNIVLDIVFVKVFHFGVAGVATATITAQALSVIISLVVMLKKNMPFDTKAKYFRLFYPEWKDMLRIGLPISAENFLTNLSFLILNAIANKLGPDPSAWTAIASGYAIDNRMITFFMIIPIAYLQAMSVFTAQNIGAKEYARIRKAYKQLLLLAIGTGLAISLLSFFGGGFLSSIFTNDADSIYYSALFLKGFALDTLAASTIMLTLGLFNGTEHSTFVMVSGLISAFAVRIPSRSCSANGPA